MPFLISSEISEIIDERTRILKDLNEAKNTAAQLHQHSSQIVQDVAGVATSEQIPAQLTDEGTPPAELAAALSLLQAEFEKIDEAQRGIKTYEDQIQREREKRRNLIIGVGVAAMIAIVVLVGVVFSKQKPTPTEQASTVPPTSVSQQETSKVVEVVRVTSTLTPTPKSSPTVVRKEPTTASVLPMAITPVAVTEDAKPLAVDFSIESIETGEDAIRFNVTIKRHSRSSPLPWRADENRKDEIYLAVGSRRYKLIEMGGAFYSRYYPPTWAVLHRLVYL